MKTDKVIRGGLIISVAVIVVLVIVFSTKKKEGYRDPIYLNRRKMIQDWYPRTNGSIYGNKCDGLFSGFAYYDKAY